MAETCAGFVLRKERDRDRERLGAGQVKILHLHHQFLDIWGRSWRILTCSWSSLMSLVHWFLLAPEALWWAYSFHWFLLAPEALWSASSFHSLLLKISDQLHYIDSCLPAHQDLSSASPIWFLVVLEALLSLTSPHKSQKTLQKLSWTTKP